MGNSPPIATRRLRYLNVNIAKMTDADAFFLGKTVGFNFSPYCSDVEV